MTKINRYILPVIVLGFVFGLGFSFGAGPASAGLSCKGMVWGNGMHAIKIHSRGKARHNWQANAGAGWNNTSLAKKKTRACRKKYVTRGHGAGQYKWHCVFKARPCKKLGLSY